MESFSKKSEKKTEDTDKGLFIQIQYFGKLLIRHYIILGYASHV